MLKFNIRLPLVALKNVSVRWLLQDSNVKNLFLPRTQSTTGQTQAYFNALGILATDLRALPTKCKVQFPVPTSLGLSGEH